MAKAEFNEFENILGQGSFGVVSLHKSKEKIDGKTLYFVVKTSEDKSLFKEFKILSEFRGCSRIIQCYGNRVKERLNEEGYVEYKMSMEYARGGSLKRFMNRYKDRKLPESLIKDFTRMLLEGLATIHKRGYVHCDLKPDNILVFPSRVYENGEYRPTYEVKISDFGVAKRDGDRKWWSPRRHRFAGTPNYMSPESISRGEIGKAHDLWSLGCVVLEMFTGKREEDYLKLFVKGYMPFIPNDLTTDAKNFLMTCFAAEPAKRKDAMTLLGYPFLRGDVDEITEPWIDVKKRNPKQNSTPRLEKIRQGLCKLGIAV